MRMMCFRVLFIMMCVGMIACFSSTYARESLEFSFEGEKWLNEGFPINFNGTNDGKFLSGKLYTNVDGLGSAIFHFYDKNGDEVLTLNKNIESNSSKEPFFHFDFELDRYNLFGNYIIKVEADHSILGWLNY